MVGRTHRIDHDEIVRLVPERATVLDLGCGDGTLLRRLIDERQAKGEGVEIDHQAILQCVGKGLNVYHGDVDAGLNLYEDGVFDYVILNETLQALHRPRTALREMLRVARHAIVGFPNFAHWHARAQLFFRGIMPKNADLPYEWYETPNIHFCTIRDFRELCETEPISIEAVRFLGASPALCRVAPNVFARHAIFVVRGAAARTDRP